MLIVINDERTPGISPQGPESKSSKYTDASACSKADKTSSSNPKARRQPAHVATAPQAEAAAATAQSVLPPETKAAAVLRLLQRDTGATLPEIIAATGWQAHSVQGFLSGTVRKKRSLNLVSEAGNDGVRRYKITEGSAQTHRSEPVDLPAFGPFKGAPTAEQATTAPEA